MKMFEQEDKKFKSCKSILPPKPNEYLINLLLLNIRGVYGRINLKA